MAAMGVRIYAGRTFHLPSTGSTDNIHLYVAITSPEGHPEETVVIVNFTSAGSRRSHDKTVTLDVGDHSFIKHSTVVNYGDAKIAKVDYVQRAIRSGLSTFHDDCSEKLLEALQQGALDSDFTENEIRERVKDHLGL
jgi:hypothetical protein